MTHFSVAVANVKCVFHKKLLPVLLWYPYYARRMEKTAIIPPFTKAAVEIIPFGLFIHYLL